MVSRILPLLVILQLLVMCGLSALGQDLGVDPPYNILIPLPEILYPYPQSLFNPFNLTSGAVKPVVDLAIQDIMSKHLFQEGELMIRYLDTRSSDAHGPSQVIEAYWHHHIVDAIIGFANVYAFAPIGRFSSYWGKGGIPVITPIAMAETASDKTMYSLTTRIMGKYTDLGGALQYLLVGQNYRDNLGLLCAQPSPSSMASSPSSECKFSFRSASKFLSKNEPVIHISSAVMTQFDERTANHAEYVELLKTSSERTNG